MARKNLSAKELSIFCGNIAMMLDAGIQIEEAVYMLSKDAGEGRLSGVCAEVYAHMTGAGGEGVAGGATTGGEGAAGGVGGEGVAGGVGMGLSAAMEACGAFDASCVNFVRAGEETGHTDDVLRALADAFADQAHIYEEVTAYIGYPAALLCIMSVIVAFVARAVLPQFMSVYDTFGGGLASGAFGALGAAVMIGNVSLCVVLVLTAACLASYFMSKTPGGQRVLGRIFGRVPSVARAVWQFDVSRFAAAFSAYLSAGVNTDDALELAARGAGDGSALSGQLARAQTMIRGAEGAISVTQALAESGVFTASQARMLGAVSRSSNTCSALNAISAQAADDAFERLHKTINTIEPMLAALMTLAVGATLIAVMLPLIGIMAGMA